MMIANMQSVLGECVTLGMPCGTTQAEQMQPLQLASAGLSPPPFLLPCTLLLN